jgi:hypothetical protein
MYTRKIAEAQIKTYEVYKALTASVFRWETVAQP